jgi:hypothetical protein
MLLIVGEKLGGFAYCSEWLVTSSGIHRTGIGNPFRPASFGTENDSCFPVVVEYRGLRSAAALMR